MKIENVDSLKKWLVDILSPIFDGDPDKLATYIVALVRKIENDQASKDRCINDLEVFLESNTNSFVDKLFDHLDPDSRTARPSTSTTTSSSNSNNNAGSRGLKGRLSRDYQEIDSSSNRTQRRRKNRNRRGDVDDSSSSSDGYDGPSSSSRYNRSSYTRSRSNSPPLASSSTTTTNTGGRFLGGQSEIKESGGRRQQPQQQRCRDFDEKGVCTMGELCPYAHGEVLIAPAQPPPSLPPPQQQQHQTIINPGQSTQMTNYPPQYNNQNFRNNHNKPFHQQKQNRNGGQMANNNQNVQNRFNNNNNNGGLGLPVNANVDLMSQQQQQQRQAMITNSRPRNLVNIVTSLNQDEQFDNSFQLQPQQQQHQTNLNHPNSFQNNGMNFYPQHQLHHQNQHQQHQQRGPGVKRSYNGSNFKVGNSNITNSMEPMNNQLLLNSNNSQMNQQFNPQQQFNQPQHQQALLPTPAPISMPPMQTPNNQQLIQQQHHMSSQQQPPQAVLGASSSPNENTILIVRKIPDQLNNPEKMRQHFSKFGQLIDIKCQFEQRKDAALVQFATNQQAFAAYKSPQSVLNNRFIRLYWYNSYLKQQSGGAGLAQQQQQQQQHQQQSQDEPALKKPARERLSYNNSSSSKPEPSIHASDLVHPSLINKENTNSASNLAEQSVSSIVQTTVTGSLVKTVFNTAADDTRAATKETPSEATASTTQAAAPAAKLNLANNFNLLTIKNEENNKKKAMLVKLEVQKKARELIEKQVKDQKLLLQKFEQAKSLEEKSQILALVKKLSESIEKEKDILNMNKSTTTGQAQDAAQQHENASTSPFSFQKQQPMKPPTAAASIPPPAHHLKLNNKRLNNTNFLKATANKTYPLNKMSTVAASASPHSSAAAAAAAAANANPFSFSRVSVDRRPKQLLFCGLENEQEKANVVNLIHQLGCQVEDMNDQADDVFAMVINFQTRRDAEVAMSKCSSLLSGKPIKISWVKPADTSLAKQAVQESQKVSQQQQPESDIKFDPIIKNNQEEEEESVSLVTEEKTSKQQTSQSVLVLTEPINKSSIRDIINSVSNDDNTNSESNDSIRNENENGNSDNKEEQSGEEKSDGLANEQYFNEEEENSDVFDSLFSGNGK